MSSFGSTPQRGSSSFGVGGTTLPNIGSTSVLPAQQFARENQRELEARRVAGNQQFIREKQARSQQARKDFLKQRQQIRKDVLGMVQRDQGRQEARIYQQRLERAVKLGERTPIPEGVAIDLTDQSELDKLREAGFDVPRRVAPAGGGGGGGALGTNLGGGGSSGGSSGRKVGGNFPDAGRDDDVFTGTITKDEFARRFPIPSGAFEVDRVAQGNNVQDVIERQPRPQPQPEPEPQREEQDVPLIDRRRTGGASGGIQGLTAEQQFDQFISERQSGQTNPFGNVGLSQQRSVPTGIGSGLTEAQRQRDAELIAQLEAEPRSSPRGRDSGAGTGLKTLKRAGTI